MIYMSKKYTTITSGEFRSRKIITPDTSATHPMGSREKLALFNALETVRGDLRGVSDALDLYCGSGALGLEALSRGVKKVVFVDENQKAVMATRQNIASLNLGSQTIVLKAKISHDFSDRFSDFKGMFQLIFVDPPYDRYPDDLSYLSALLEQNGIAVISHPRSVDAEDIAKDTGLSLAQTKSYAAANLSFLKKMA